MKPFLLFYEGAPVAKWRIREWNTVVGELLANPVRPEDL